MSRGACPSGDPAPKRRIAVENIIIRTERSELDQELTTLFASINQLFPECKIQVLSAADPLWKGNGEILHRDLLDE